MISISARSPRLFDRLVQAVAALVALLLPLGFFGLGYTALGSALEAKATIKAEIINQSISVSPDMWRFEELRLKELLHRFPVELPHEHAQIHTQGGELVAESNGTAEWPALTRSATLYDAGRPVGRVQLYQSMRHLLLGTTLLAALGLLLAGAMLGGLRVLRARERKLVELNFAEQERARVTLKSIADAVITTDAIENIQYLNPAAEQLTGWSLAEARGRPLAAICRLVDERRGATIAISALRGNDAPEPGVDLSLVNRAALPVAVEMAAAPMYDSLGNVVGGVLVLRDVTTTRGMAQRIRWAAAHDSLTGLVNRHEFESRVDAVLQELPAGARHAVFFMDLDQFKIVNDSCGHAAGDELLKQVAVLLQNRLRTADTLARLGGDEFGVLLENCPLDRAQLIATDLLAVARDFRYACDGKVFNVGVSIGLVEITAESGSRAEIFGAADAACYAAKEQGRNRVCVFHPSDTDISRRRGEMGWVTRLTRALEEDRLTLYYQPYLALSADGAPHHHIEILLRLIDDGRLVPPGSFLPAAERYNLMPAIDRWVIGSVFSRYAGLVAHFGAPLTCAINLSGTSINADGLLDFIRRQAELHRVPAGAICFEITETAVVNNLRRASQFMKDIKALGFRFALDDFGIGASSFGYLKSLPVDYLKIDGSFVRNIAHDPVDRAMAETINRVGHIMGLKTVGEYAVSAEAIDELRAIGVDFAQGNGVLSAQPLPVAVVARAAAPAAAAIN